MPDTVSYHCELKFWEPSADDKNRLPGYISEPLCVISGIVMSALAIAYSASRLKDPPLQFYLARASLVVCGLGTAVYHMLDEQIMADSHINGIILDGASMAMVTVNIFLLHTNAWMRRHTMFMAVLCTMYLLFWIATNDLLMFQFLEDVTTVQGTPLFSLCVQYPLFIGVFVYILARVFMLHGISGIWPMWACPAVALCAWVMDKFGCSYSTIFFLGHVLWHICIGYVAVYLIALGLVDNRPFQIATNSSKWWPSVIEIPDQTTKNMHSLMPAIPRPNGHYKKKITPPDVRMTMPHFLPE